MKIVSDISEWSKFRKSLSKKTIGFVPTMGNLHAGHLSLCQRSQQENDMTVTSIFVNPTQFNRQDDFDRYPRTLEQDKNLLLEQQIDFLLLPQAESMYPDQYQIQVTEAELSKELEGEYRPGHFNGMLTIVLKLLNLVQPTRVYFGEKDFQQLLLVKKLVQSLFINTEVIGCPTIRAEDGLALSSRNSLLNREQREQAVHFPKALMSEKNTDDIIKYLEENNFKVDYIAEKWGRRLGAVWLNNIRLIDNVEKV